MKFDGRELSPARAPQFAEHSDELLRELGVDDQKLIDLTIAGAIT